MKYIAMLFLTISFIGCMSLKLQEKIIIQDLYLANFEDYDTNSIPVFNIVVYNNPRYLGRLLSYEDGSLKLIGSPYKYTEMFQKNLNDFADNADIFFPGVGKLTPAEVVNNDEYFTKYKDTFVFRYGGVEVDSDIGKIYLANKWREENPKFPLLDHIIYTGNQEVYIIDSKNAENEVTLRNGNKVGVRPFRKADKPRKIYAVK